MILWLRVYYNIFNFNSFTQLYVFGLPIMLLLKIPFLKKKYYERTGIKDITLFLKRTLTNPKNSTVIWLTDIIMCILIMVMLVSLYFLFVIITSYQINGDTNILIALFSTAFVSIIINYFLLWRNFIYLEFFKKFKKEKKSTKFKWAILTVFLVMLPFVSLIYFISILI